MVFREVRRVLRDDGTLWLNLGDSYATGAGKAASPGGGAQGERFKESGPSGYRGAHDISGKHAENASIPNFQPNRMPQEGLKPKDLCEIPSDVVRALRADGWWLRSRIPWLKRNAMPESTKDRPTTAVEYVFLLSKSERYYYDGEAVKMGSTERPSGNKTRFVAKEGERARTNTHLGSAIPFEPNGSGRARRNSDWFFESWQGMLQDEGGDPLALIVNPQPFKEAHFATFPPALIEPCILAGCPPAGKRCDCDEIIATPTGTGPIDDPSMLTGRGGMNRPRRPDEGTRPITKREQRWHAGQLRESPHRDEIRRRAGEAFDHYIRTDDSGARPLPEPLRLDLLRLGWITDAPPCTHPVEPAGTVLDPFGGAGTTGLVADRLQRDAILIELNPAYADIAEKRIHADGPLFAEVGK